MLQGYRAPVIEQIGKLMAQAQMASVVTLPNARVPVVKFVVPETATKVICCPLLMSIDFQSSYEAVAEFTSQHADRLVDSVQKSRCVY